MFVTALSFVLVFRFKLSVLRVLGMCAAVGAGSYVTAHWRDDGIRRRDWNEEAGVDDLKAASRWLPLRRAYQPVAA